MKLTEDRLQVSRELSELDEEVVEFVGVLEDCNIEYVIVSGYVAILTGRSRATEDIDIVLEPLDQQTTKELVETLKERGYWGMAMPLDEMYTMLSSGDRIRVAEEGEMIPNFEMWFAKNEVEREALDKAIAAELGAAQLNISPLELQIAYKLRLAQHAGSTSGKDFEDALHLYETFEESLNREQLEEYVTDLGVEDYYDQLKRA
ncbi:nucleotidyltransferase [Halobacterium noricense]|uniref:nucleotidyltransferase n=1 Tax=Halobacterium noricense TaxID=223182 RepID=UPI001E638FC7|nr:nucleotidyltransferase [Halobacterium noricense]UHH26607.1 nucleotidyltransferase [Halobacterium noricense]